MHGVYSHTEKNNDSIGVQPNKVCGQNIYEEVKYADICLINALELIQQLNKK